MPRPVRISKKVTRTWASSPQISITDRRLMKAAEFQRLCTDMGITDCIKGGEAFGLSWRTVQRYWYGELPVPGPLARLLRLAKRQNLTHKELLAL